MPNQELDRYLEEVDEHRVFLETSNDLREHEADTNRAEANEGWAEIFGEDNAGEVPSGESGGEGNIIFYYDWISDEVRGIFCEFQSGLKILQDYLPDIGDREDEQCEVQGFPPIEPICHCSPKGLSEGVSGNDGRS